MFGENYTLEVYGGTGDLEGAVLHVMRPAKELELSFTVEECVFEDSKARVYRMTPISKN